MTYYVYMLSNNSNSTLYTGVTSDISLRVNTHKNKVIKKSFSARYNCSKLVHLEEFSDINEARYREFQLKNWKRSWKNELIEKNNPSFSDLSEQL